MSKITFRADDDLVARLDGFEASKSQVMREALRAYLDGPERAGAADGAADGDEPDSPVDSAIRERVDALVAKRLDELGLAEGGARAGPDRRPFGAPDGTRVTLTVDVEGASDADRVSVDGAAADDGRAEPSASDGPAGARSDGAVAGDGGRDCAQCGESLSDGHEYCPNCGEKASRRLFCDCGDEVRADWAFCPGCGRRTPAADVLDGP